MIKNILGQTVFTHPLFVPQFVAQIKVCTKGQPAVALIALELMF